MQQQQAAVSALPAQHTEQGAAMQACQQPKQQQRTRPTQGDLVEKVLMSWKERQREEQAKRCAAGADSMSSSENELANSLIDIGLNLADKSFAKDRDQVLARAARAGVVAAIVTGTCTRSSAAAQRLAGFASASGAVNDSPAAHPALYFTAGVHPHNAKSCGPQTLDELHALAAHPRCVAIGECGLDFNRNFSPPAVQEEWFARQIQLAEELRLPLFMHCRDAHLRFVQLLREHRLTVPGVVHCFTSSSRAELKYGSVLQELLSLGLHIGITGWVCDDRPERGGKELAALLPLIPDDRLLLETDAPYLTPRTIVPAKARPQRNEPALLPAVLSAVAAARGQDAAHVAAISTANAKRLFRLTM